MCSRDGIAGAPVLDHHVDRRQSLFQGEVLNAVGVAGSNGTLGWYA